MLSKITRKNTLELPLDISNPGMQINIILDQRKLKIIHLKKINLEKIKEELYSLYS